jgi:hypothetical protein
VTTIYPCGDGPTDPRSLIPIGHFQGQKNVQVLTGSAGSQLRSEIRMWSRGGKIDRRHTLEIVERRGDSALDPNLREHLLAHRAIAVVGAKPGRQRFIEVTSAVGGCSNRAGVGVEGPVCAWPDRPGGRCRRRRQASGLRGERTSAKLASSPHWNIARVCNVGRSRRRRVAPRSRHGSS